MLFLHRALEFTIHLEAVTADAAVGQELAEAQTSWVFDQWLAIFTISNLQLQNSKLLRKLSAMDNFLGEMCKVPLFIPAGTQGFLLCKGESKRERGREGLCVRVVV